MNNMDFFKNDSYHKLSMDYVIDRLNVYSPFGKKEKKLMSTYLPEDRELLSNEFDRIEDMLIFVKRHKQRAFTLQGYLKDVKDLTTTFERILKGEVLSVTELFEIKMLVNTMMQIKGMQVDNKLFYELSSVEAVAELLDPEKTGIMTYHIYDMYSDVLEEIRREKRAITEGKRRELLRLIDQLSTSYGIKIRPNGEVMINKKEDALIERMKLSEDFNYVQESYVSVSFSIRPTELLDQFDGCGHRLLLEEEVEEEKVRKMLTESMKEYVDTLWENTDLIGKLDLLLAKAILANGINGVRPEISKETISIVEGRHIEVEASLRKKSMAYTPVSMTLSTGVTCITGANMGGKTVSMKLAGMLYGMAHLGMFVPAKEFKCPLGHYVITSIGDSQNVDEGLSTFGGEIIHVQEALNLSKEQGLILIDELARGTNPSEGFAISKAIIHQLMDKLSHTLITTHFDGLSQTKGIKHLQVVGLKNIDFQRIVEAISNADEKGMEIIQSFMDYRLIEANSGIDIPKDAINIATLMGLDINVIEDAKSIIKNLGGNDE